MADPLIFTAVGNHETGYEGVVTKVACGHRHQTTTEARACIRATLDAERATVPDPVEDAENLASALLDAVAEAINAEALPGNIHHRLKEAYNAVVKAANR